MAEHQIRFDDGAAYERIMGNWSRLVGEIFLDWLAPHSGLRWIDVGCGNGAFTELLVERCAPAEVQGIDPSEAQLAFARARPAARVAQVSPGRRYGASVPRDRFDAAVMALVIFFVPDPAKGVAEMVRVVCPGGTVTAYAWDMFGGGFPWNRSRPKCARWALRLRSRRAPTHLGWKRCGTCGRVRASKRSKRGRSPCNGHSPISTTSGRPALGPSVVDDGRRNGVRGSRAAQNADACAPAGRRRGPHHLQCTRQRDKGSRARVIAPAEMLSVVSKGSA